jgi:hypothetical protein
MRLELHIKAFEWRVSYLGFGEYLADKVDRPLHSKCMAFLASLDYNSTADNMQSPLGLLRPLEHILAFQELEEG